MSGTNLPFSLVAHWLHYQEIVRGNGLFVSRLKLMSTTVFVGLTRAVSQLEDSGNQCLIPICHKWQNYRETFILWSVPWTLENLSNKRYFKQTLHQHVLPSDSYMSCSYSLLGYSTGEFQALQLTVLAHLPSVYWSNFQTNGYKW